MAIDPAVHFRCHDILFQHDVALNTGSCFILPVFKNPIITGRAVTQNLSNNNWIINGCRVVWDLGAEYHHVGISDCGTESELHSLGHDKAPALEPIA